tara:strand:- start:105 stop:521 length:417 start_codon:yes stop_codon:yes gene_type:complete
LTLKIAKPPPRESQVQDELLGKIITSLIQFKLTNESKHYLDTIDLLDELVLETTGPQDDILSTWESALMGVVFDENGDSIPCYSSARVVEQYLAEGFSKEEAASALFSASEGLKMMWIHPATSAGTEPPAEGTNLRLV